MESQEDQTPRIELLRTVALDVLAEESSGKIELPESREIIFVSPEDILCLIHNIEDAAKAMNSALEVLPEIKKEKKEILEKNQTYAREVLSQELKMLDILFGQKLFTLMPKVSYNSRGIFPTKDDPSQ